MAQTTLLFAMLNETGHLNPTFKLAKELSARGHDVRYLAMRDLAPHIEVQGFRVESLYPDLFPEGRLASEAGRSAIARRRAITERYLALLDRLAHEPPFDRAALGSVLLLIDVTQTQLALWARGAGVPFLYVNTSLPQGREPAVPPLRSGAPYDARLLGRLRAGLAWERFLVKRRLSAHAVAPLGMAPPYALARAAAARFGVAPSALDDETVYMPQLRGVPELVLCPEVFDFPRPARATRHYVESIDLTRREASFPWEALAPERPLLYCALGGQRYRAGEVPRFFQRVLDVVRARPDWQLVLAHGKHVREHALAAPPNAHLVESAPQLAMLRRARLMITHGGLGSVKECLIHAVPMLGVPLDVDQPGNVARIVHHGLGLAADVRHSREPELADKLARLLDDPSFAARARAMQARVEASEQAGRGVQAIEQLLEVAVEAR